MAIKPSTEPNPLSFPAHTFAKLAPRSFLHANLSTPNEAIRPSGRTPSEARLPTCTTSSLSHCSGSAVVRLGDTAVVCGARAEILLVRDIPGYQHPKSVSIKEDGEAESERRRRRDSAEEMARLNLLVPNLELATGCSPAHLRGGPPSELAQTLSQRILTLLHTSQLLDIEDLRIWYHPPPALSSDEMDTSPDNHAAEQEQNELNQPEIKAYWTLYIDILFISLDGNPFDAAWGSLLAALADVRLPRTHWDADLDMVLCDDDVALAQRLKLRHLPVAMSFGVIEVKDGEPNAEKWILVDMDGFEEGVCREGGTVVVKIGGGGEVVIVRMEKNGGDGVGVKEFKDLTYLAGKRWKDWRDVLKEAH